MNNKNSNYEIEDKLFDLILNHFSIETGKIPIGLFDKEREFFSAKSKEVFSGFCSKIYNDSYFGELCREDHRRRAFKAKGIEGDICHAGLFNMAYPIFIGNELVATILCGQRIALEKKQESEIAFKNFLIKHKIEDSKKDDLVKSFNKIEKIKISDFNRRIFNDLVDITKLVYFSKREKFEKDRENIEKVTKINGLIHELLIPMQALTSNAENILIHADPNEEFYLNNKELIKASNYIYSYTRVLGMLANNVQRDIISKKVIPYRLKRLGLHSFLKDCIEPFKLMADEKKIIILDPELDYIMEFPSISMDRPNLLRAFMNIYHNTVKYSYSSSIERRRWISTKIGREDDDRIKISISNYGVGIKKEEIEKVFIPGYRGELAPERGREGSGLGLSEAKKIILNHNGDIKVFSENMGDSLKGPYLNTVVVYLPS